MNRRIKIISSIVLVFAFLVFANHKVYSEVSINRLYGADRYGTSTAIAKQGWTTSNYAVLASGANYPDALAAAPLAKKYNAPILLTDSKSLKLETKNTLIDLGVKNVFIVGGTGVVSSNIENQLKSMGINVERLAGKNRYETCVKVAQKLGSVQKVVLVSGNNFPDALAVAPIAAIKGMPILLVDKNSVYSNVKAYIDSQNPSQVYVVGGTGVITDDTLKNISNKRRLSGKDRYETNVAVLNEFISDISLNKVYVASGANFPDALSGAALAAKNSSPIVLTSKAYNPTIADFTVSHRSSVTNVFSIGGTTIVPQDIVSEYFNGNLEVIGVE
ncbi:cell wall-binding repeat-containing protein [Haloimpatiens sp. FM7330]|uniref:cell wall-binding repeat-containing protein n=1 Tax=Haloimpatiens sp. FM7330 TaxID=3298610 RepID=UPI00363FFBF9